MGAHNIYIVITVFGLKPNFDFKAEFHRRIQQKRFGVGQIHAE
jgi:hypothetical protein